ncbi:ATP:ADP antiporter, AAA family [Pseudomonas cuatrocienegasensis]|uniref:ADP,ATP carrier protein n=1 Tax=Pseudomonas cuatrocienegasensis TaxID=543360 RepID=A0ABY1BGA3_9PSED|nr:MULTISPECIES: Npt1/Npt2 family nucleotide transporter [Pseudomonas]OEC33578.1 ADP/ATP translocating protein [Pseudomonas sp. 21C1]SEQ79763.1 ATP:ADP antiporter, AAA family [Pseudomonas cuatrocienegasensis]
MTPAQRLVQAINARPAELSAALCGFALFFCLFSGYFMLRPIREAMGIQGGVENLQWLFTATFFVMLAAVPLFAWLNSKVPRARYIDWVYGVFISQLLLFAVLFQQDADAVWLARTFYVWISVYNLFVVSVAWSLMADVFDSEQARRLFAFIAAGASCGGLAGPAAGALLVDGLGQAGLIFSAAGLLGLAVLAKQHLMHWRALAGAGRPGAAPSESPRLPVLGNPFSGLSRVLGSRYLLGISAFVILLATASTFLYFEQARLVEQTFSDRNEQIRVFGLIDFAVQALALLTQLFITGRVAQRFGLRALLAGVPVLVCLGFIALALAPTFAMLAALMIMRRVGEYAFVRPGREMLFAPLDAESKYKAKNFIDTVVYRAGDAVSAWAKTLLDMLANGILVAALAGAACAALWGALGWYLGGRRPEPVEPKH